MTTIEAVRADRLLILAEKFLVANSPWDAIESASSASQLDGEARQRARQIISEATKLSWDTPRRVSDEVERLRRFKERLQADVGKEPCQQLSNMEAMPDLSDPARQSGDPVSADLRRDLSRVLRALLEKEGRKFERARAVLQALLERCPPCEPNEDKKDDDEEDTYPWCEFTSLEHDLHNLGNTLYKHDRYEEAIEMYDLAIHLRPDLLETYFNRGLAYTRLARYELAEEDLTRVIGLNPNLAEALYTRGLVREYKFEYDKAIADYDQALSVDPSYQRAEVQRGVAKSKKESKGGPRKAGSSDEDHDGVVKDYSAHCVKPDCRLSQVGDHMATKREFRKILTFLGGGDLLVEWGGELPRGVLLYGEAGAGKTHLARALAGEADVPFYAPPMSLIFDMYVGNSERNVRNLFQAASQHRRAIIFFDELDVIASKRSESRQAHEPWQARLSACLLEEMDNIAKRNANIVVIGATNCVDAIDDAFLRPGRFTYVLEVKRPGEIGMAEIFLVCLETASLKARRADFLDTALDGAVLAPRRDWLEQVFRHDHTGLAEVARMAVRKEMVGDDVREVIRRVIDERIIAGLDGVDLGPISVDDLRRHVQDYVVIRKTRETGETA